MSSTVQVPLASTNPPISPSWPQTAEDALTPFSFYVLEPHHSGFCCSVVDNNWTPREPAVPVRSLGWATRRHFLTTTDLMISSEPSSVPAATTVPSNASGDHHCDQQVAFMLPRCTLPRFLTRHKLGIQRHKGRAGPQIVTLFE
jgi:hypothetical protein